MKVCIISSIFPPYARGGAEMVAEATARAFAEAGHAVFVITGAPFEGGKSLAGAWQAQSMRTPSNSPSERGRNDPISSPARGEVRRGGSAIRIFRFTPLNLFTYFSIAKYPPLLRLIWHLVDMFNPHTFLVVRRILYEEQPDLIVTRNLKGLGYTVPLAIRRYTLHVTRYTPKWFHGLHDLGALHPRGYMEWGKENAIRNPIPVVRLYRAICRKLLSGPDAVVAPSQFVLEEYNRAGFFPKAKKAVIPNPVVHNPSPPPQSSPIKGEEDKRNPPPLAGGVRGGGNVEGVRFLFIGQLEPYKGLRVLISAWRQFVAGNPRAGLEIIGRGSMKQEAQRAAKMIRGIICRGFVAHHELFELMKGARAMVVPSLAYETFGLAIVESFSSGVPVIASRIGAIPEIVEDGVNGILVVPGDPQALTSALTRMMGKEQEALAEGAAKSAKMSAPEAYYDRLLGVYNSIQTR
ncbi:glycosyltransferase [Candidatus Uhrbacteria bacterium]|nr:glycosyltransferase [Candidatus Uhrbacteria bacterium]